MQCITAIHCRFERNHCIASYCGQEQYWAEKAKTNNIAMQC